MKSWCLILILFICCATHAQIITDLPDQTESSSTVGNGNLQIETGVLLGFSGGGTDRVLQTLLPSTLFRYGFGRSFELRLLNQVEGLKLGATKLRSGLSDLELGAKLKMINGDAFRPEVALLIHFILPTGGEDFSTEQFGSSIRLCVSKDLNEKTGLGFNIGYNYLEGSSGDLPFTLSLGNSVNDKTALYIEVYGEVVGLDTFEVAADAGFTYLIRPNLQLDYSFGVGLTQRSNYVSLGISWLAFSGSE